MLNELINDTLNPILKGLDPQLIETLGGLTQSITRIVEGQDGPIRQSFPVTFNNQSDVFKSGAYTALCPDSQKKSLAYWRFAGANFQPAPDKAPRLKSVRYGATFAYWANLPQFGHVPGHIPYGIVETIRGAMEGVKTLAAPNDKATATIKAAQVNFDNPVAVFGQHTFADDQRLFMWPFGYFGILFDIVVTYDPNCLPTYQPTNPIKCTII